MDIRSTLVALGTYLVERYGYQQSNLVGNQHLSHTTRPVLAFRDWLHATPPAVQFLGEHGLPDFPAFLTNLATELQRDCGFHDEKMIGGLPEPSRSTGPIIIFLCWLQNNEESHKRITAKVFCRDFAPLTT